MFKSIFAAMLALAAAPVLGQSAIAQSAPTPASQLAQVQRHLAGVSSMTASFTQTDRAGKVLTGTLTLKKPGKVRFQYEKGVPLLAVADGNSLYFIDYSVRQVSRWPIGQSPMRVLLDPSKDISGIATLVPTANPDVVSVEVRDPKHPEYGRITLIFARDASGPAGLQMQGWVALDSQNNRTTIRLSNQKLNVPVSDGAFRWNDPRRSSPRG
ncbi:outer membrane lipoprotein carrier protein LolA [Sphingomonas donggukensis]|uniref:Outer membrane lipoprotein carrier protein LolA n=1 Tax=Sphingomonas donggukensis TaxID=2949093 RepID=A0ABY4TTX0_9SPHN|nr:outer membrane lipoprotein carrier protein LolA [Sphingomonas donggukensis]URW75295.1 outer membrane lipoprotein carrier protein LolA [Sphingomonas donggukensis]